MTLESKEAHLRASARRPLAGVYLRDAQRQENSLRTRADISFDATYLCALACLDIAAQECEHPSPDVLQKAAGLLGLTAVQIEPAIAYARCRYRPLETDEQSQIAYQNLLALAKTMLKTK